MATHHQRIFDYMERFGSISPMEAFADLGETKLSTRIGEMKRRGIEIEGREEIGVNRFGQGVRYMRYRLRESGTSRTPSPTKKNVAGSVIIGASGGRIATPSCATVRNDTEGLE